MKSVLRVRAAALLVTGSLLCAVTVAACSHRDGFSGGEVGIFDSDAATDAGPCPFVCSLDGRSVTRSCTGEVTETCAADQACGAGVCQEQCAAAAADRSSNGCEFFLQPPMFTKTYGRSCYAAFAVNTSTLPVDLSLELQGQKLDISRAQYDAKPGESALTPHTGSIAPGESVIVFVSDADPSALPVDHQSACPKDIVAATYVDALPEATGMGASFHLTSNAPIGLTAIYPYGGASSWVPSATLLLPVATWAKQHIIVNAWEAMTIQIDASGSGPSAQIVASEDDTNVTILSNHDIQDGLDVIGTAAHVPATYHLDKGQLLQLDQFEELSGSIVTSDKPTGVFGGHECMNVPSSRKACDSAGQQIPPFEQWGSEYVGVGYRPRAGNEHEPMPYRIVAARDGTRLDYDPAPPPGAPLTMEAGEVATFWSGTGEAFVVRTQDPDHAIYLAAYMSGGGAAIVGQDFLGNQDFRGAGDPEFVNVIPAGQYLSSYSFFADPTYDETSLVVVRAKTHGEFKDVWLECAGDLTGFQPVGTRGDYEYVRVDLQRSGGPGQTFGATTCKTGLQRMHSDGAFTATIWGWAQWASYAYPGGSAQRKLVANPLPDIH